MIGQLKENKNLKINILFNDQDAENIKNLKKEIQNSYYDKNIIRIQIANKKYEDILPQIISRTTGKKIPKFFFLDLFTYSNVKMKDLKRIMSLDYTEVLLFIPIFHSYRFSNKEFDKNHKTRIFVEEFTSRGISDYSNVNDFLISVREKLKNEINLEYVRPVLLDGGASKNSLILLTKHRKGMILMNQVAFKYSDDGNVVKVKELGQESFFSASEVSMYSLTFKEKIITILKSGTVSNIDIVDFSIKEGFLPKHIRKILVELLELNKIKFFDIKNLEVIDKRKLYIAEVIKEIRTIKWIENESN